MPTFSTSHGDLQLLPPSPELLRTIAYFMPFGFIGLSPEEHGARFGIVMQCGAQELYGVKQQPLECYDPERQWFHAHTLLIAHSLAGYLAHGFSGLFLPCAYERAKAGGRVESGLAYFGYPFPEGREAQPESYEPASVGFDKQLGHGFAAMMVSFIGALGKSAQALGCTLQPVIGFDIRPRLHLEHLGLSFMLVGPQVVCLQPNVDSWGPFWEVLRSTGIEQVFHVPSLAVSIREDQLHPGKKSSLAQLAEKFPLLPSA
jgi:hypothetical protein